MKRKLLIWGCIVIVFSTLLITASAKIRADKPEKVQSDSTEAADFTETPKETVGTEPQPEITSMNNNTETEDKSESVQNPSDTVTAVKTTEAPKITEKAEIQPDRGEDKPVLTVDFPKTINKGEKFTLTAKVSNPTDRDISYTLPTSTPDMHYEIRVKITDGVHEFIDDDTYFKCMTCDMYYPTLKSGDEIVEKINFLPAYSIDGGDYRQNPDEIVFFDTGEYKGQAVFYYTEDGQQKSVSKDFTIKLTDFNDTKIKP